MSSEAPEVEADQRSSEPPDGNGHHDGEDWTSMFVSLVLELVHFAFWPGLYFSCVCFRNGPTRWDRRLHCGGAPAGSLPESRGWGWRRCSRRRLPTSFSCSFALVRRPQGADQHQQPRHWLTGHDQWRRKRTIVTMLTNWSHARSQDGEALPLFRLHTVEVLLVLSLLCSHFQGFIFSLPDSCGHARVSDQQKIAHLGLCGKNTGL